MRQRRDDRLFLTKGGISTVLQSEGAECGLACIAMVCAHYRRKERLIDLRRRFPISIAGATLRQLINIADELGFTARAVRCELSDFETLQTPCILHWHMDHFVVLGNVRKDRYTIHDPARGKRVVHRDELSSHFTGIALLLAPGSRFLPKTRVEPVRLSDLWSQISGLKWLIGQTLLLTVLLQAFGLIAPLANQIVVDDVISRGDRNMLITIICAFAGMAVIQQALELLRGYVQLSCGQRASIQLSGNLLRHILRLPLEFFERRHMGDLLSRYGSLGVVQDFVTRGVVSIIVDLVMILPVGTVMFLYSSRLSWVVVASLAVVFAMEWFSFSRNRRYAEEVMSLSAQSQTIFLETLRGIGSIKMFAREAERFAHWENAVTHQQNASYRQASFNMLGGTGFTLLTAIQSLLLLYLGANAIIDNNMTLGMLFAFQSYSAQFVTRGRSLLAQFFSFRMLDLHLERLAEIVYADPDPLVCAPAASAREFRGQLAARDLSFRYGPQEPWVLREVNLQIGPGERVTFVGPSGGGKSTLVKLLTGLYVPCGGSIEVDNVPISAFGVAALRSQIGVVMQDDQLLSGTIADNVCFFDPQFDMARVEEVCRIARLHDTIVKLPMAYFSRIGDMGSMLSAGQRQRLLLARALYCNPRLLLLDEGTANLDITLEDEILQTLRELQITRIMIAHRQAAIDFAERVYVVANGTIQELRS